MITLGSAQRLQYNTVLGKMKRKNTDIYKNCQKQVDNSSIGVILKTGLEIHFEKDVITMKLKEYIKMGIGIYIGWTVAKNIDIALGKTSIGKRIFDRANELYSQVFQSSIGS